MMECMTDSAALHHWWEAARPHTWPNAFAPVIAGTGAAAYTDEDVQLFRSQSVAQ